MLKKNEEIEEDIWLCSKFSWQLEDVFKKSEDVKISVGK